MNTYLGRRGGSRALRARSTTSQQWTPPGADDQDDDNDDIGRGGGGGGGGGRGGGGRGGRGRAGGRGAGFSPVQALHPVQARLYHRQLLESIRLPPDEPVVLIDAYALPSGRDRDTGDPAWKVRIARKERWAFVQKDDMGNYLLIGFPARVDPVEKVTAEGAAGGAPEGAAAEGPPEGTSGAALAGLGVEGYAAGASRVDPGAAGRDLKYKDYTFLELKGQYVYRLYKDGSVRIMQLPSRSYWPEGLLVQPDSKAHAASTAAIKAKRQERAAEVVSAAAKVASAAAGAVSAATPARRGRRRAAPEEAAPESAAPEAPEPEAKPWAIIGLGVAAAIVLAVVARAGR